PTGCNETRTANRRTVVKAPGIRNRPIQGEEVTQAASKPPTHGIGRHVMSSCTNSLGDSGDGEVGGRQPEKDDVDRVTMGLESGEPSGERLAGERRLESKALALILEFVQPAQHDSPGVKRDVVWSECRQPLR